MLRVLVVASFAALFVLVSVPAHAQTGLWSDTAAPPLSAAERVTVPQAYRVVRLDAPQMRQRLGAAPAETQVGTASGGTALSIPLPEGGEVEVRVVESSIMAPALQAKYPEIRTYLASGPGSVHGRLSYTPAGFRGMLFAPEGTLYIDPYAPGDTQTYIVYRASDLVVDPALRGRIGDEVRGAASGAVRRSPEARPHGETLRTYRLAMAATGEYTAFHGGTVAGGMAGIVTTVNRVTGLYERDLSVRFELVPNNDTVVFTNPITDPYSNDDGVAMLGQNIATLDALIGTLNYDVGHVFSTGGGGVAFLGVICDSQKAGGVTGLSAPTGDAFDVDYVAHEMGHQFGGNHTFNGDSGACAGGNRNGSTAYEPGSGSTIQAYAGICGNDNLQSNSDPYFHAVSLDEMTTHVTTGSGGTCGVPTATGNDIPVVSASGGVTIPAGTPFTLTGSATDATPEALTYTWEEFDLGPQADVNAGTIPLFRSFEPTPSRSRTFPQMSRLLAGQPPVVGETLPTISQTLTFRLTARDNQPGGGAINDATVSLDVDASAGPFEVTFASTSGESYSGAVAVTWHVAGTASGAVNTPTVDILFSSDNGATFDTVLASGAANDGSHSVTLPNVNTTEGRILIRGVGNVFFNVNPEPFEVTPATGGTGPIVFTAPASGVLLTAGTTTAVTWDPGGVDPSTTLILNLKSPTQGNSNIVRNVPNTGSYSWAIPATQASASDYRIIGVYVDPASGDKVRPKTNPFEITGGVAPPTPITVTAPEAGDVLTAGATTTITWDPGDIDPGVTLQIRVLAPGSNVRIAKNEPNDGAYTWAIPSDQAPGTAYRVQVVYTDPATRSKLKPKSGTFEIQASGARPTKAEDVLALLPVQPNPTRGAASVPFSLVEAGDVRVSIHDVRGREVAVLASGRYEAGLHRAAWASGEAAPGVYVVRLQTGGQVLTQRAVVVR